MGVVGREMGTLSTGGSGYDNDTKIREMQEYVSTPGNLSDDPQVRGDIHRLLGRSWRLLGEPARGAAEYRAAVRDYATAFGESHELTLKMRYALVRTLSYMQTAQSLDRKSTRLNSSH